MSDGSGLRVNADFGERVVVDTRSACWVPSPLAGVERKMLDRIGGEVARATSIVRYAPGSRFSAHCHAEGEEFLVLRGTFSDEHGHYPAGTYVRNPPGSGHAPYSDDGCEIFVKLRQIPASDRARVVVDTASAAFVAGESDGVEVLALHEHGGERVRLVRLAPGARLPVHAERGGEEILVLEGGYRDEHGSYLAGTWARSPGGSGRGARSDEGALLYVKIGHLGRPVGR